MKCAIKENGLLWIPEEKAKNMADDNLVYSFKGRTIDLSEPILIYRNLTKKGVWYSIRQGNVVVAHAQRLCVSNCKFLVNQKGRERVVRNKKKEVHAFIKGKYSTSGMGTTASENDLRAVIRYNPYYNTSFICENLTVKPFEVKGASFCICDEKGVKAAYLEK